VASLLVLPATYSLRWALLRITPLVLVEPGNIRGLIQVLVYFDFVIAWEEAFDGW
jgi:hypothetical protein